jgi:predicted lipoprotein with Yx(FWY)xxD motif
LCGVAQWRNGTFGGMCAAQRLTRLAEYMALKRHIAKGVRLNLEVVSLPGETESAGIATARNIMVTGIKGQPAYTFSCAMACSSCCSTASE